MKTLLSYVFGDLGSAKTQKLSDAKLEEREVVDGDELS